MRDACATLLDTATPAGRRFALVVLTCIVLSTVNVCLETVESVERVAKPALVVLEGAFLLFFIVEYAIRCCGTRPARKYILSAWGVLDFVAWAPNVVTALVAANSGLHVVVVLRLVRLARVFRVLRLAQFSSSAHQLFSTFTHAWRKIMIFVAAFVSLTVIVGALMYGVEGAEHGFTSIPQSMYWAVVTLTTVGFGDIYPQTSLGRLIAAVVMLLGYSLIVVPTSLATMSHVRSGGGLPIAPTIGDDGGDHNREPSTELTCDACPTIQHNVRAVFCYHCGRRVQRRFSTQAASSLAATARAPLAGQVQLSSWRTPTTSAAPPPASAIPPHLTTPSRDASPSESSPHGSFHALPSPAESDSASWVPADK